MSKLFRQSGRTAQKLFSTTASTAHKLLSHGPGALHQFGSGLGSAAKAIRTVEHTGNAIINGINNSALGPALMPLTAAASKGLHAIGNVGRLAAIGKEATRLRGNASQVAGGLLEKGKKAEKLALDTFA
jgi:hypothetical protein